MVETLFLIIMAAGIGLYQDMNKPTQFELNMEDGTHAEIVLIVFGFAFIQTINLFARIAYTIKEAKSKTMYVIIKIAN